MRKALGLLLVLGMVAAACGDDDGGAGGSIDPANANSCEELADVTVNLVSEAIDSVDDMDMAAFLAIAEGAEAPPEWARMESVSEDLEARSEQLGCSEADSQRLVCERLSRLEPSSEVAELVLGGVMAAC